MVPPPFNVICILKLSFQKRLNATLSSTMTKYTLKKPKQKYYSTHQSIAGCIPKGI